MSDHKEADSRIFLHISHAMTTNSIKRVLLWSIDSDVAAMCRRYCLSLGIDKFYFKTGVGVRKRYVPMHLVAG